MPKIFLIAGLGADTRIYNNIELGDDHEVIPVDWIEPNLKDTLATYSHKLVHQYNITQNDIVIGNSLGGMIATEIAKLVSLKKVILISSIKTVHEAPWYFKVFKHLPVYKLLPGRLLNNLSLMIKPVFGKMSAQDAWLFTDMLKRSSPKFMTWAMGAVLHWDNRVVPANMYHINGNKDLIFHYKKLKDATIVEGGTHIMIFDKAKHINKLLKNILKRK